MARPGAGEIWLPDPAVRGKARACPFWLHLVHQRTALNNRIHQVLVAFGVPCPFADLFGEKSCKLLTRLALTDP